MFGKKFIINFLEKQVEDLKKELETIKSENFKLQAAIVARESPMAYEHYEKAPKEESPEKKQAKADGKFIQKYINALEDPLFQDADEMIHLLGATMGVPKSKPLHENNES